MTAHITQSPTPTAFDWALFAAVAAGWTHRAAFDAVVLMKACGVDEVEIARRFDDCRLRIQ
jgi:hypothetical protein